MTILIDTDRAALVGLSECEAGSHDVSVTSSQRRDPVSLSIPTPPSVNQAYKNTKRGRAKTDLYIEWRTAGRVSVDRQKIKKTYGRVLTVIGVERSSLTADIDNRIKLLNDLMVDCGLIEDDRFITATAITWMPFANAMTHVQIIPIEGGDFFTLQFQASLDGATGAWISAPQSTDGDFHV